MEQIACISKLRFEVRSNFITYFVAAIVNSGTDGGPDVPWRAVKPATHLAHALFHDPLHRTSPSRVKHTHRAPLYVHQNDGKAISCLDSQQQTGSIAHHAISHQGLF